MSIAGWLSGMRCSLPAFILPSGMVQTPAFRSISCQVAPRTSPDRAAVRMANSSALAPLPGIPLSDTMNAPIWAYGRAAWCSTLAVLFGADSSTSRCPFHRAGLGPVRYSWTVAQSRILSMRPRTLVAVSVLSFQIGRKIAMTWGSSTSFTRILPMCG